jgi:hypothetical protein
MRIGKKCDPAFGFGKEKCKGFEQIQGRKKQEAC